MALEVFMRLSFVLLPVALSAALLTACGDRTSNGAGQGNEAAAADATTPSPDEAAPAAAPRASGSIDTGHKGEAAPTLGFVDPAGKPVTLAAFRGKPVLLNLWATWCGPCVKELPTLDALALREAGKLTVVTLSQDMDPAKVAPFFAARNFKALKAYTDPKMAWVPAVANNLPTSILYDAQGKEVWRTVGDLDWTGKVASEALAKVAG
jgi:thiol-disulfide isomerase/thioredoxin/predicted small secreted protein